MYKNDELIRCYEEIRRLKAENRDLRRSSESFGHLAERLNLELRAERRLRQSTEEASRREPEWTLELVS